jgi:hypothetical protein
VINTEFVERLDYLASIEENWDGPGSKALLPEVRQAAESALDLLGSNGHDTAICLTGEGGLHFEWINDGFDYSAEIEPSLAMWFYRLNIQSDEDDDLAVPDFDPQEFARRLAL